ncbi:MAG: TIGR03885 family FMN-dependent LLM class oxidoreductase [Methanomicrobiaceae archaeon]|nr:TIGR03885 family FMN-dependent LLM class oxidoreductase [Methanomicrobiaceae archaeon]
MNENGQKIGYYASHEQFRPRDLLTFTLAAEAAGFRSVLSSDHFHPWSETQGESGFAWSWLGAAMHATTIPFGIITAPGYRYHPAVLAQSAATLADMFPGRFWMGIGSGEVLNEGIIGERWPNRSERNERLLQCAGVMRDLWAGARVTFDGHIRVDRAHLYTRPPEPPLLFAAANACSTVEWVAGWADGLITLAKPVCELKESIELFRKGGGEGKRIYLKLDIAYARTEEEALRGAWEQWRNLVFGGGLITEIRSPAEFDAMGEHVDREELRQHIRVSSDLSLHTEWLQTFLDLGVDKIYLHNVTDDQATFIEDFGREVLPALVG